MSRTLESTANSATASLSFCLDCFSTLSKSAKINSKLITSISYNGSTPPATWVMFSSSKHLTTWQIASTSRMWLKNLFPNPSPLDAPFTIPAISVNSNDVGTVFLGSTSSVNLFNLWSGTSTIPTFGSIVAKG